MTVAAETMPGSPGILVTLVTEIAVVIVPGALAVKSAQVGRMDCCVGSQDTVKITMTTTAGTGRVVGVVT